MKNLETGSVSASDARMAGAGDGGHKEPDPSIFIHPPRQPVAEQSFTRRVRGLVQAGVAMAVAVNMLMSDGRSDQTASAEKSSSSAPVLIDDSHMPHLDDLGDGVFDANEEIPNIMNNPIIGKTIDGVTVYNMYGNWTRPGLNMAVIMMDTWSQTEALIYTGVALNNTLYQEPWKDYKSRINAYMVKDPAATSDALSCGAPLNGTYSCDKTKVNNYIENLVKKVNLNFHEAIIFSSSTSYVATAYLEIDNENSKGIKSFAMVSKGSIALENNTASHELGHSVVGAVDHYINPNPTKIPNENKYLNCVTGDKLSELWAKFSGAPKSTAQAFVGCDMWPDSYRDIDNGTMYSSVFRSYGAVTTELIRAKLSGAPQNYRSLIPQIVFLPVTPQRIGN